VTIQIDRNGIFIREWKFTTYLGNDLMFNAPEVDFNTFFDFLDRNNPADL
jgi:hypothetical protein